MVVHLFQQLLGILFEMLFQVKVTMAFELLHFLCTIFSIITVQRSETVHFVYSTDAPSAAEKNALCQAIIDAFPVLKDSTTPRGYVSNFNLTILKTKRQTQLPHLTDMHLAVIQTI